jgi:lipid-binding SYLF domain-containing protein
MNGDALEYLDRSKGFEAGVDANIAVVNQGVAVDAITTTIQDPITAFVFGQQGLKAGATLQGSEISIHPK